MGAGVAIAGQVYELSTAPTALSTVGQPLRDAGEHLRRIRGYSTWTSLNEILAGGASVF